MTTPVFTSSSFIVANALASFLNSLSLGTTANVSVDGVYNASGQNDLIVVVSPLTTVLDRESKDIVRERVATQITFVKRSDRSNQSVDFLIKKIEDVQMALFFANISSGGISWIIEQAELNGNVKTSGGENFDGIYESEDLGDAGVFKTNIIVASCRFLKKAFN